MIALREVRKSYGHVTALDDFQMTVPDKAVYGLVGPAGAGKTTVLRLLSGILYPDSGSILIDEMEAGSNVRRLRRRIGYVPDHMGAYPNICVEEYMDFFAACYDLSGTKVRRRIQMLLEMAGLGGRERQQVETLPRGMQQKLSVARALLHDPKILVLDEPGTGMDPSSRYELRRLLTELAGEERTILISAQVLTDISELCTDIGIIDRGKLLMEGKLPEVLKRVNATNPIIISIEGAISEAMRLLKRDRKVKSVSIRDKELLILYEGSQEEEAGLLEELVMEGIPVRAFHREKGNLEALFMQLTGSRQERRVSFYEAESDL